MYCIVQALKVQYFLEKKVNPCDMLLYENICVADDANMVHFSKQRSNHFLHKEMI